MYEFVSVMFSVLGKQNKSFGQRSEKIRQGQDLGFLIHFQVPFLSKFYPFRSLEMFKKGRDYYATQGRVARNDTTYFALALRRYCMGIHVYGARYLTDQTQHLYIRAMQINWTPMHSQMGPFKNIRTCLKKISSIYQNDYHKDSCKQNHS